MPHDFFGKKTSNGWFTSGVTHPGNPTAGHQQITNRGKEIRLQNTLAGFHLSVFGSGTYLFLQKNKNLGAGFRFLTGSYSAENQHFV